MSRISAPSQDPNAKWVHRTLSRVNTVYVSVCKIDWHFICLCICDLRGCFKKFSWHVSNNLASNLNLSLHKIWSFPLRISSVNVTKSAFSCGFGHIYWRNPLWKTSFFLQCILLFSRKKVKASIKKDLGHIKKLQLAHFTANFNCNSSWYLKEVRHLEILLT